VSGGESGEGGVAVTDCQTAAAAAAAAAAVVSGSRLTHAVSPALGYYLMPGYQSPYSSGVYTANVASPLTVNSGSV